MSGVGWAAVAISVLSIGLSVLSVHYARQTRRLREEAARLRAERLARSPFVHPSAEHQR